MPMINTKIVIFDNHSPEVSIKQNTAEIISIRTRVFVEEQNVDSKIDFDGRDDCAIHALIYYQTKAVGTARMLEDGHIGRVAVLKEFRNKGVGTEAMKILLQEAKLRDYKRIYLGSQVHASEFYGKLGFEVCSEIFMEAGIQHIEMELFL